MAIHQPGRRLMHAVPLVFVRRKIEGGGHRSTNSNISLTSMIDFLIVTVVFLLMTFSASGETPIAKGITLPKAQNTIDMIDAPMVQVIGSDVLVNGTRVDNTRPIEESDRLSKLEGLSAVLQSTRVTWRQTHPGKDFPGVAVLQIDQNVPALVVKAVFQTSAYAGYPNISFMVDHANEAR